MLRGLDGPSPALDAEELPVHTHVPEGGDVLQTLDEYDVGPAHIVEFVQQGLDPLQALDIVHRPPPPGIR